MRIWAALVGGWVIGAALGSAAHAQDHFTFRDVGAESGVLPAAAGIRGHGAAWGDVDDDGCPDLFVASFHNQGSQPGMLLKNKNGKFTLDAQQILHTSGMGSGALFADFTNSGRLDLYVSNCAHGKDGPAAVGNYFFINEGGGRFTDASAKCGACPAGYEGRGVCVLDYDGDGLLDLLACEQYYSPDAKTGPALYRNLGGHRFADFSKQEGLPAKLGGLGVAAADVNRDGWSDIFLTHGAGEHRLLLNDGTGTFAEAPGARDVFRWKLDSKEDAPAGVCIADLDRDGLPEIAIGHHFKQPWVKPAPVRLYWHKGVENGIPRYEEITDAAGLKPLPMKAPHVEFQDFDNDGWPDLLVSVVKFADGRPHPLIYKNLGVQDGPPKFEERAWSVNDFPTADDRAIKRSGDFFDKVLAEKKIIYTAPGPTADFDRDGKLDVFLPNWWLESPSLLLKNETPGGRWLSVRVEGAYEFTKTGFDFDGPKPGRIEDRVGGVNRMGVGAVVNVYPTGKLGDAKALLGSREIAAGYGYCSGQEAEAHFGLGDVGEVDLEIVLPHGKGKLTRKNVKADQRLVAKQSESPAE